MTVRILFFGIFLLIFIRTFAQMEQYPIYKGCETVDKNQLKKCFQEKVSNDFYLHYTIPQDVTEENNLFYVVFVASKTGVFEVLHVSSNNSKVNQEVERVFENLSKFEPASYGDHFIDKQFILYYPNNELLDSNINIPTIAKENNSHKDSISIKTTLSTHRIPFSNFIYNQLDADVLRNQIHTSVKPYIYQTVIESEPFEQKYHQLLKNKTSWWGRKFWNENFVEFSGENYWFHIDPIIDLNLGKDNSGIDYTYNNTRAVRVQGALYKKFSFSSTIYESQGRFAEYFNLYALSIKPGFDGSAIVPGQGNAKQFGTHGFDYPVATSYLSYSPNKTFNFQFGRDKNFIGDGYRSLFLSDAVTASTYAKIQTNFWKIQYTNLWLWLRDVRTEVIENGVFKRKFVAIHHLSWNATKRLNIGLFESVLWAKTANQGFDVDYLNPIILFRPIEFSKGSQSGNALIGMNAKYNFTNDFSVYSQVLFDEITIKEITGSNGYWANKYAFQIGSKYFNAFHIKNLTIQAEYNLARPFTYSHNNPEINYGHYNQSLAHPWGSNFREFVFIADFQKNRWFGTAKAVTGIKGFDYNSSSDTFSYGGDIYRDYSDRNADYEVKIGQGNKANIFIGEMQTGYLINPATNLKLFGSVLFRKFEAPVENPIFKNGTTTWFSLGLKSDLTNWYFDF